VAFALVATDDGISALDADGTMRSELEGTYVSHLARGAGGHVGIADERRIIRRGDGGTWIEVGEADDNLRSLYPYGDVVFAGTDDGRLVRFEGSSMATVEAFGQVDGREDWHAVPSGVPYVRSFSATADGRALLANVHVGGIPRSVDGGETWEPTIDPEVDVHEVRGHPEDAALVVAAAGYGFAQSTDGGVTWTMTTDGMHSTYCRAVGFTIDAVLVTVSTGPFNAESGVYRRDFGDTGPFTQCIDGLPERFAGNIDTGCLDARGEDAVLVDATGAIYASGDAGHSWYHLTDLELGGSSIVLA
jgi:photosystem II stability/assembly factor-like uncharacterized protein